ncbi:hypothetical protein BEWA_004850 [Theileria equi strain WA]|uniref:Uncharacterized protein n=1 Tax=Theileria equi strain WA TaxID=1537102 RepID=L0AZQ1_THEEQ|nr:hypothetical protein BEWA_004850 [Theileria equi strain WA]AFZ81077.1 hypothetical protein BEWA_004850 [Theileria equi strain WA]|eukprot:XP_004830743.1 hypothetical protein BEWA_004850 [Theileria equi strain WA]
MPNAEEITESQQVEKTDGNEDLYEKAHAPVYDPGSNDDLVLKYDKEGNIITEDEKGSPKLLNPSTLVEITPEEGEGEGEKSSEQRQPEEEARIRRREEIHSWLILGVTLVVTIGLVAVFYKHFKKRYEIYANIADGSNN